MLLMNKKNASKMNTEEVLKLYGAVKFTQVEVCVARTKIPDVLTSTQLKSLYGSPNFCL